MELLGSSLVLLSIGAVIFILFARHYGFVSAIGIFLMLFGIYGMYQQYVGTQEPWVHLPLIGDIYTGLEKPFAMLTAGIFILIGFLLYKKGAIKHDS